MSLTTTPPTVVPTVATRWNSFRGLLEARRSDCLRQREIAVAEAATSVPDPVALNRAAGLLATIREIDAALDRIAEGTYGWCVHCGIDIPLQRLEIRPFATGCVTCQAAAP